VYTKKYNAENVDPFTKLLKIIRNIDWSPYEEQEQHRLSHNKKTTIKL
jgi:hypothetical protein